MQAKSFNDIYYKTGSILEAPPNSVIVHGCNCQGVMGSGVALAIKTKWPVAYETYKSKEKDFGLWLGEYSAYKVDNDNNIIVINGHTQDEYGRDLNRRYVDYEAVTRVFEYASMVAVNARCNMVIPKIGAGLANGNWSIIEAIINYTVDERVGITCYVPPVAKP